MYGQPITTLNPLFHIDGEPMLLATQHLAAVSRPTLGETVASLADERETIVAAVDLLFTGI